MKWIQRKMGRGEINRGLSLNVLEKQPVCPKCAGKMELKEVGFFKVHEAVLLYILGIFFIAFDLWINVFADSASHTSGAIRGTIWIIVFIGALFYKIQQNILKKIWECPACQNKNDVNDSL